MANRFLTSGNSQGRPLLLIHPMGADKSFWDRCRARWDDRFFSVACDLDGAGLPPVAQGPFSFDRYAENLEAVAAEIGLEKAVVVGCAVGSMVAVHYAAGHPGRAAGLVLANPGIRTRDAARTALARRAADARAGGMDAVAQAVIDSVFLGQADDGYKARFAAAFRAQDPLAYAATIEAMLDADIRPQLEHIHCPLLLVPGDMDRLLPPDHADEIRLLKPLADLVLVEGAAHFIPYQRPDEFAELVRAFADRLDEASG